MLADLDDILANMDLDLDAVAPLPIVSDPFWTEFNNWRVSCPDDYNQWVDRNQPGQILQQDTDNEPGTEQPQVESTGSSQYVEINKARKMITKICQIHRPPENKLNDNNKF